MQNNQSIFNTTLAYIEKNGKYLMLHRNKKENDINKGRWIGVGGKFEFGETPEECMEREVFEETGLEAINYIYSGLVTFVYENSNTNKSITEYMHLFKVTDFEGVLKDCDEGELEWIDKNEILNLNHYRGDELFLSIIKDGNKPFFSIKLWYINDYLKEVLLDTVPCFITDNLILRPWSLTDAENLYKYASEPEIGLSAGWQPHKSIDDSIKIIEDVLTLPGEYAIVLKRTNSVIGSIGLKAGSKLRRGLGDNPLQAEIGYWIGKPFWGKGFVPEAARVLIEYGFRELELNRIWIAYFDGNERSKRVAEKLGFVYDHSIERREVPALRTFKKEHFTVLYS